LRVEWGGDLVASQRATRRRPCDGPRTDLKFDWDWFIQCIVYKTPDEFKLMVAIVHITFPAFLFL
jgi:hypothetical protein